MIFIQYNDYIGSLKTLRDARILGWKVCFYGLGKVGRTCSKITEYLDIYPDYYCDRNKDVLDNYNINYESKITYEELLSSNQDILVILMIGIKNVYEVKETLVSNTKLHIVTYPELLQNDEIITKYFGIKKPLIHYTKKVTDQIFQHKEFKGGRIAVYTCITNGYDLLREPTCIDEFCDYYFITDNNEHPRKDTVYKYLDIKDIVPKGISSPKDQNRYCKMHGYSIFSDYKYSVYVDGSLQIIGKISELIAAIGKYGVGFHSHPYAEDPYVEMLHLSLIERVLVNEARPVAQKFAEEGFPREYGSVEGGLIVCDNSNPVAREILNNWYENYMRFQAKRDQIYLPYTLFKMGISVEDVNTFKCNLRSNGITKMVTIHTGYQR